MASAGSDLPGAVPPLIIEAAKQRNGVPQMPDEQSTQAGGAGDELADAPAEQMDPETPDDDGNDIEESEGPQNDPETAE